MVHTQPKNQFRHQYFHAAKLINWIFKAQRNSHRITEFIYAEVVAL